MDSFDVRPTQRAIRRLTPEPIPDAVPRQLMGAAICAPSGGNRQSWSVLVIRDAARRARLGELYRDPQVKEPLGIRAEVETAALIPLGNLGRPPRQRLERLSPMAGFAASTEVKGPDDRTAGPETLAGGPSRARHPPGPWSHAPSQ